MTHGWPAVRLGDVLKESDDSVLIEPSKSYREITVRLHGRGVVQRRTTLGAQIAAGSRRVARVGDLILSRIDARHGALGIVPPELEGGVVSNDFPLFAIDSSRLLPEFLGWMIKTEWFREACNRASEGSTNRVLIKMGAFLEIAIPLPPLPEQQALVNMLGALDGRMQRVRELSLEIEGHVTATVAAGEHSIWANSSPASVSSLESVTTHLARGRQTKQGESKHVLVKTQHVQMDEYVPSRLTLAEDAADRVDERAVLEPGDILIACSAAGCLGRVARWSDKSTRASTDSHVAIARPDPMKILPEYLYAFLRGAPGQFQLRSREKGDWTREKVGFRLTELNVADLRQVPVPVLAVVEQARIASCSDRLHDLRRRLRKLLGESSRLNEALMPSILHSMFAREEPAVVHLKRSPS